MMININLLDWREQHRQQVTKGLLFYVMALVALGIVIFATCYWSPHQQQEQQTALVKTLSGQVRDTAEEALRLETQARSEHQSQYAQISASWRPVVLLLKWFAALSDESALRPVELQQLSLQSHQLHLAAIVPSPSLARQLGLSLRHYFGVLQPIRLLLRSGQWHVTLACALASVTTPP